MGRFDINHKTKCPLCGKNMDFIYGDMVCSDCGYRASYASSSTTSQSSASTSQQIPTPKITYTPPSTGNTTTSQKSNKPKNEKSNFKARLLVICLTVIYVVAYHSLKYAVKSNHSVTDNLTSQLAISEQDYSSYLPDSYGSSSSYAETDSEISDPYENSEGVIKTVELLFDKDITDVTDAELASVEYLDFYYYDYYYKAASCGINTGDDYIVKELFLGNVSFYDSDFSIFPNLSELYLDYGEIASLEGLNQLTSLSANMTPAEIAELIDPSQITALTLDDLFFANDFNGIESFTNLVSLSMDAYYVENLDALTKLKNLKALTIYDSTNANSLKVLYEMPQLEYLNLDCEGLRDIGFVSNMPNLSCLVIWNSELKNINALADCSDSLVQLDLRYNYQLNDYDVVSKLTNLEVLSLYVPYSFENPVKVPQLGNMPNLTQLLLGNFEDLSGLEAAPELQSLSLQNTYAYDLSVLSSLQKLTSLELYAMSLESTTLETVMELTELEYISLNGSYIWGNAEMLLSLPNLKEFYMENCVAGFDTDHLVPNESLEVLNLNHAELHILENGTWNYGEESVLLPLAEHTDIFKNYPNLQKLYVAEQSLENIQFAASLPYLEVLDLTDNYVTDLTPLALLPNLESVLCHNNPIAKDGGLGAKVSTE